MSVDVCILLFPGNTSVQLTGSLEKEWPDPRRQISSSAGERLEIAHTRTSFPKTLMKREQKPWIVEIMLRHVQGAGWEAALEKAKHPCSLSRGVALLWVPDTKPLFPCQGFKLDSLAMSFGLKQCSKDYGHKYLCPYLEMVGGFITLKYFGDMYC